MKPVSSDTFVELRQTIRKLLPQLSRITVLVMDDDVQMNKVVRDMLDAIGFEKIHTARDGASAIKLLQQKPIDMVLTDWRMEPMDGINFTKFIRTSPDSPNRYLPIIMMTGQGEKEDVELARDTGVNEFLVKPFTVKSLMERIITVIENPRNFVMAKSFKGPDRRRRDGDSPVGVDRRKRRDDPFGES